MLQAPDNPRMSLIPRERETMPEWLPVATAITLVVMILGIGIWIGAVNTDRTNFKEFMAEVRDDIKTILGRLPPTEITSSSPLRLTELGKTISKGIDAPTWADRIVLSLQHVQDMEAYEIQDFCFEYVKDELALSKEEIRLIRSVAYENGVKEEQVRRVLAIEIRDKLLALDSRRH